MIIIFVLGWEEYIVSISACRFVVKSRFVRAGWSVYIYNGMSYGLFFLIVINVYYYCVCVWYLSMCGCIWECCVGDVLSYICGYAGYVCWWLVVVI